MIIFTAGNEEGISVYRRRFAEQKKVKSLWSYFKFKENRVKESIMSVGKKVKLFLDSGAFSAFTQKIEIDIQEYISFIKKHKDIIEIYSNLDSIGDAKGTLKNQKVMEKAGLSPLPCFHYGEPIKYLKYYLQNYDYIALGGMVPISTQNLQTWLDEIYSKYICDKEGIPKVKVHGFGLTSLKLMQRYPWYSVDSTSWVMTGRMGGVLVPKKRAGKWDYSLDPWKVCVSSKSPSLSEKGQHITTFSNLERKTISQYFEEQGFVLGKSKFEKKTLPYELDIGEKWSEKKHKEQTEREVEILLEMGLSNDYKQRDMLNIQYYLDLEKSFPKWPQAFKLKSGSFF